MTGPPPGLESPRRDRRDFVRAFHEHLWRKPGSERPTLRPQTIMTFAVLAAAGALVTGVVLHLLFPRPTKPPAMSNAGTYAAVSGWDCPAAGSHGFEIAGRSSDWYTVARGGWNADGCL